MHEPGISRETSPLVTGFLFTSELGASHPASGQDGHTHMLTWSHQTLLRSFFSCVEVSEAGSHSHLPGRRLFFPLYVGVISLTQPSLQTVVVRIKWVNLGKVLRAVLAHKLFRDGCYYYWLLTFSPKGTLFCISSHMSHVSLSSWKTDYSLILFWGNMPKAYSLLHSQRREIFILLFHLWKGSLPALEATTLSASQHFISGLASRSRGQACA